MNLFLAYNLLLFQSSLNVLSQFLTKNQESYLSERNIYTIEHLLWYLPTRYESRTLHNNLKNVLQILEDQGEMTGAVSLVCEEKSSLFTKKSWSKNLPQFIFRDGINPHRVIITGFNPKFRKFQIGTHYILIGKLKMSGRLSDLFLDLQEYQEKSKGISINVGELIPIYRSIKTISSEKLRSLIHHCLSVLKKRGGTIPYDPSVPSNFRLTTKLINLQRIHFPKTILEFEKARKELALEELFAFQTKILQRRKARKTRKISISFQDEISQSIEKSLPYQLRQDQKRVLQEIKSDLQQSHTMSRLLQGEVGCGKTVICMLVSVWVAENHRQCVMLAPTEILAKQHFEFFQQYIKNPSIKIGFFSKSNDISQEVANGDVAIIVATHAALQKSVRYKNLGCVIIDEQQRFGVQQREDILQKGSNVDLLMVSATPIPHSLGLILYGDLDISEIRGVQPNVRKSKVLHHNHRTHAYKFLKQQVQKSEQGLIIFPFIEDRGEECHISLLKEYEYLQNSHLLKDISMGIVHGQLSNAEKQTVMDDFIKNKIQIICSTSILEVGIDHPNATVIIIEGAERFGLCQLHQMRGRVGRGNKQGYCYVIASKSCNTESLNRLEKFCTIQDGFALANLDLSFRGYGDILGTQQSGLPKFQIARCPGEDLELALSIKKYLETGSITADMEFDTSE